MDCNKVCHVSEDRNNLEILSFLIGDDLSVPASCERRTVSLVSEILTKIETALLHI